VMRMREVKAIDLPQGKTVTLKPGGFHIMLMNLEKPIAAGDVVPLTSPWWWSPAANGRRWR